jgi:hypothetical protein
LLDHRGLISFDFRAVLDHTDSLLPRFGVPVGGNQHGFLATPSQAHDPEPSTLLLLAIGTLGLMGWGGLRSKQIALGATRPLLGPYNRSTNGHLVRLWRFAERLVDHRDLICRRGVVSQAA